MFVICAVCAKMKLIKVTLPLVTFYSIYFTKFRRYLSKIAQRLNLKCDLFN